MAALSFKVQPATQARRPAVHVPPIQHLVIPGPPVYRGYQGGYQQGYQQGCGGGWSTGCHHNGRGNTKQGCGCTAFADHMAAQGRGYRGGIGPFLPAVGNTQCPFQSNLVKTQQLECVLFVWFGYQSQSQFDDLPIRLAQTNPRRDIHAGQCPGIHIDGVGCVHQEDAQDDAAKDLLMGRGREC